MNSWERLDDDDDDDDDDGDLNVMLVNDRRNDMKQVELNNWSRE